MDDILHAPRDEDAQQAGLPLAKRLERYRAAWMDGMARVRLGARRFQHKLDEATAGGKRLFTPLNFLAVAAVVALILVIGAVRSTTASFRSSPERLVAGLQKALDDKDVRLFAELALPAGTSYESSDYSRIAASDLPNLQLELVEVFSGRKDTYALAIVRYTERESLSPGDGQMEVLMLSKTDGKWYNSNTTNAFLRGLLGTVDYSYQYVPDSYDDPYAVPD